MNIKSERLASALRESGLTQVELCKKAGVTAVALSSYLSGRYFPKQKTLERLADALNVSVVYLMGFDTPAVTNSDQPIVLDDSEIRLIEMYRSLNPVGRRKAAETIDDLTQIDKYIE